MRLDLCVLACVCVRVCAGTRIGLSFDVTFAHDLLLGCVFGCIACNSFGNSPQTFSTVYGTLAVVEDKFFFGDSDNYFYRCACVHACACVCVCACPLCLLHPLTCACGAGCAWGFFRFDLATGQYDGVTVQSSRNTQMMGFDGQNVCVSDTSGNAQCFQGERVSV